MKQYQLTNEITTNLRTVGFLVFGCIWMMFTGCSKEDIHAYDVPHEFDAEVVSQDPFQSNTPSEGAQSSEVVWDIPEAWSKLDIAVQMRVATFMTPPGLEVTVASFPGNVGGLLANVNRWRGQVGVGPIEEQELAKSATLIEGTNSFIVDVTGASVRLVGTVIYVGDGQTWFVKAVGEPEAIEQVKADVIAFSSSFHLKQIEHGADEGHNHAAGVPIVPASNGSEEHPNTDAANWEQPSQWKVDTDASPILKAAYFAESGARVTLTALGGGGGGTLDNINRWRDQLGLSPVETMADQPLQDLGNGALIVDLVMEDGSNRIVAGIVPVESQTLFFKLTGSVTETEPELERFIAFVHGVGIGRQGEH